LTAFTVVHGALAAGEDSGYVTDVTLVEEYRLRVMSHVLPNTGTLGASQGANQQTDQHLRLLGDFQLLGPGEHFRAVASGALWWDIDGGTGNGAASVFATQYDNAQPFVAPYTLSAEWQKDGILDHARVGRQSSEHGMPLTFDGASLGVRILERELLLFGFGGRTVHFFETKPGLFENWVASTGAVYRPTEHLALELDTRVIQEQTLNSDRSERDKITNFSYGVSGAWRSESMYSKLYARGVDRLASHVGGAYQFHDETLGFGVDARVNAQLLKLGELVESENPYFSLLGTSLPYVRFRFESWKDVALGEDANLSFHLGLRGRQLLGYEEQPFNRNTGAVYLNTRLDDVFRRGTFMGATADYNFVPKALSKEYLLTVGGYAGFNGANVSTELGTYYQQFKINYYQRAEELHNTRTVYCSVGYRLVDWLELRGRYEIDIFDRYLQSFFFSARQDF
jgi:hypothetical protein